MKISLDYPDALDSEIMRQAHADGHNNRAAVIRKAITFYLTKGSHKNAIYKQKTKKLYNRTNEVKNDL